MAGAQQPNQSDNSAGILWGVAAIFAITGMIWFSFKNYIIWVYLFVKLSEVHLLNAIFPSAYFERLNSIILYAIANPAKISFSDLMLIGSGIGKWMTIPLAVLFCFLAIVVYFANTVRVFKRTYSMRDLAKLEKVNWPQISPVIGLDLIKSDIDKGPWAMALSPMQFCKRYKLLEEVAVQRYEGMHRKDWDRKDVILKRGPANKLFALQLGQLWKGVNHLPPHTKALFAVFCARITAETVVAANLLAQLSVSSSSKLNLAGVDALIKKHENNKQIQEIVNTHAYVLTVMASMLQGARDDGVQASADFLWLKPVDRRLWYTLNTVGRQTPFVEVGGVFAHWVAEKEAGRKLTVPMVEEATKALEVALKEVVYRSDED